MAKMKLNFNEKAFRREIEKQARGALQDETRRIQRQMDQFTAQYAGLPVAQIKPALKQMWERDGGSLTDPELTEYAEIISEDGQINFQLGDYRW